MTRRPLLCRLRFHKWHWESAADGHRYQRCARCGLDSSGTGHGPMDGAWPMGLHIGGRP